MKLKQNCYLVWRRLPLALWFLERPLRFVSGVDCPYKIYWQRKWFNCYWTIDNWFMFKLRFYTYSSFRWYGLPRFCKDDWEMWFGWFSITGACICFTDHKYRRPFKVKIKERVDKKTGFLHTGVYAKKPPQEFIVLDVTIDEK